MEQINKYHNGKIYSLRSPHTNKYYIGSTTQSLSKRLSHHKMLISTTSKIIFDYGDVYIELIENFKCENKDELNKREGELIRQLKNQCVNHNIPCRTQKEYQNDNKEKIKEYNKQYQKENRNKINTNQLNYYNNHKNNILLKLKEKIPCSICNIEFHKCSLARHIKRIHP